MKHITRPEPLTGTVHDADRSPAPVPRPPAESLSGRGHGRWTWLRLPGPTGPRPTAALLAAVITVTVFCAGDVIAGSYPFGPRTRSVNDLGNQYVPFHAHLWDLLHGRADGGLLINWQSGFGSSFLPDLGTYLSSPFALLVGVFPRDEIDLAVYVITLLKVASAGAAMAWLLLRMRPGPWWAAGLLGASYALCGWTLTSAAYNVMWLDGLIALPLLCLVGEWTLNGRRPYLGVLIVAVAWIANFYTAYMATLAAALVLLLRLWLVPRQQLPQRVAPSRRPARPLAAPAESPSTSSTRTSGRHTESTHRTPLLDGQTLADAAPAGRTHRQSLAVVGRACLTVGLGIGLAAPLLMVVYFGTTHAYPGVTEQFEPATTQDLLAHLLPTTYGFGAPALYVGTTALLLALALPFHRAVPRRVRAGWTLLVVAVALSLQWDPTHLLWHAFATPQGSPYRQAFVLCALLVIAAWHALSYGVPGRRALCAAGALLALITAVASASELTDPPYVLPLVALAAVGALGGLALLALQDRDRGGRRRAVLSGLAVTLLIGTQLGEAAATAAVTTRLRFVNLDNYAPWGTRQEQQSEKITEADGWPRYRTDPGREQTVGNDPLLVGGQGAQYYSSLTSDVLSRTLTALGDGWTSRGRNLQSLDNAVTDVIFSVGARVHSPPDPHQKWFPDDGTQVSVTRQDVPPLVTVRPSGSGAQARTGVGDFGASPYRNQELLLGTRVYTVPRLAVRDSAGQTPERSDDDRPGLLIPVPRGTAGQDATITANCRADSEVYLWAPHFSGTARLTGESAQGPTGRFRADHPVTKIASMQRLGTVPASGQVRIELSPDRTGVIPDGAVGCLDTARLRTAAEQLKTTGATEVTVSDGTVRAQLPAGSTGTAVLAAPRIAGWRCALGDGPAVPAQEYYGLIAVPLDGSATSVTCTFHPPGLRLGTAVGATSLLAVILLGTVTTLRRRRSTGRLAVPTPARRHDGTPA